jgi:type III pantothenate kinase
MGRDRIALVAGAVTNFDGKQLLIIDAGTCITYDLVIDNHYLGGAISPGLQMRYQALHNLTASLPLLQRTNEAPLIGNDTANSIHSGVINGQMAEINGMIARYQENYNELKIIVTGGDISLLSSRLKSRFFAAPDLVLQGMYQIYKMNTQE